MLRESFEEYLDGELGSDDRLKVEAAVAGDPRAASLMAALKGHRALRAAAIESNAPSAGEARALASHVLALCEEQTNRPLWRITPTVKRLAAVAAAVIVVAGAFMAGRTTAPVQTLAGKSTVTEVTRYRVAYVDESGTVQVKECDNEADMAGYVASLEQHGVAGIQVADLTSNHM